MNAPRCGQRLSLPQAGVADAGGQGRVLGQAQYAPAVADAEGPAFEHVAGPAQGNAPAESGGFGVELAQQQRIADLEVSVVFAHVERLGPGFHRVKARRPYFQLVELAVVGHGHLDVIQAGNSGDYHPDVGRLQTVLAFVRRQYSTILIDLPGGINRLSTELMQQSKVVFLVTTSEVASLHMARRRWRTLRDDLQLGDRVRLLVNRVEKKSRISMDELASAVGLPVHASFVNDYAEVQKAILVGGRVPSSRPLGQQLTVFAESLFKDPAPVSPVKKHRFLEAFALSN